MTREDRQRRQARNERRGRRPERLPVLADDRVRYYRAPARYGGYIVRSFRGRLEVVRVFGQPVRAAKGAWPRAAMGFAKLSGGLLAGLDAAAEDRKRKERLEGMGVELPKSVYQDPITVPTGAWT